MNKIYASTVNETIKALLKKKTIFLMLFSVLVPALMAIVASILYRKTGVLIFGSADFSVWVLGIFTSVFLPLFIFMWSADSFAGELEDLSLKIALLRPITRFKVYLAKNLATINLVLISLLIVFVSSQVATLFIPTGIGFMAGLGRSLVAYVESVFPLIGLIVIAAFVSQLLRSSSGALAIGIIVYIVALALPVISPLVGSLIPTAYTNWHLLWLAPSINWRAIGIAFLALLANYMVFFPAGYFLFERKDI
jgi:ABC-2 type transport system permease protein